MAVLKKGLISLLTLLFISTLALYGQKNYYISSFNGSDSNTGLNPNSPWKSIEKLESLIPQLVSGDAVYLERGSVWYEVDIKLQGKNGSAANPIKFDAYGNGPRPVLSGGVLIDNFTKEGNIYTAPIVKDFNSKYIVVPTGILINGKWQDIARSQEYFTTGNNSATYFSDNNQSWNSNGLVGSYALIQSRHWQWNPSRIISNSSNSINFNEIEFALGSSKHFAYYIANNESYLNSNGDWLFKDRILKVYYDTDLNKEHVQFAVSDSVFSLKNCSNISVNNIVFELSNYHTMSVYNSNDITITNCEIRYTAGVGINLYRTGNLIFKNNYIHDCGAVGLEISEYGMIDISHNLFRRIASNNIGMCNFDERMSAAISILYPDNSNTAIRYNYFDSVGIAVQAHTFKFGESADISYNYVENYGISVSDCGAFYFASDLSSQTPRIVKNNTIRNAVSAGYRYLPYGDNSLNPHPTLHPHAIYMDEGAMGYICDSNSIENTSVAFYSNRNYKNSFTRNNVVNGDKDVSSVFSALYFKDQVIGDKTISADRDTLKHNNLVLSSTSKASAYLRHINKEIKDMNLDENKFYFDYNKIASPFAGTPIVGKYVYEWGEIVSTYTLDRMRTDGGETSAISSDHNSVVNPQGISYSQVSSQVSEEEFVKIFTNYSASTRVVNLGNAVFKDIDGNSVSGNTTVPPFYSKILFYASGNLNTVEDDQYVDSTIIPALILDEDGNYNRKPSIQSRTFTIQEVDNLSLTIGTISATDPDPGQDLSFSINSGNSEGLFAINNSGVLSFSSENIDFTGDPEFHLTVRVTDNGVPALSAETTVHIYLKGKQINNPPYFVNQEIHFRLEPVKDLYQSTIVANDPDKDLITFEIISGNPGLFSLNEKTGELSFFSDDFDKTIPLSYELVVRATDNGSPPQSTDATILIKIFPQSNIIYIDPSDQGTENIGSYYHPYNSLQNLSFEEGFLYLIKRNTAISLQSTVTIDNENITIGAYGEGENPVINSESADYVIKSMDNSGITIEDLDIVANDAISCLYFLGPQADNIKISNCKITGSEYGVRLINSGYVKIQYCTLSDNEIGLYSIADRIDVFYNVFVNNYTGIHCFDSKAESNFFNNVFFNNSIAFNSTAVDLKLNNNIFYSSAAGDVAMKLSSNQIYSDYNLFWPVQDNFIEIQNTTYNSLDEVKASSEFEKHSIQSDPKFTDMDNYNFELQPGSPAIDNGTPVGLAFDIRGLAIPYGDAPDIGVIEAELEATVSQTVSEVSGNKVLFYPNPVSDQITVIIGVQSSGNYRLKIYDVYGKLYLDQKSVEGSTLNLKLPFLKRGIYLLQLVNGNSTHTLKFIKL